MPETLDPALPDHIAAKVEDVLRLARDRDVLLTTAESCTGGLLASLLTDVSGFGHLFERGFVAYSKEAKCDLLGLDRAMVEECGAVSREVAVAMARGALARSRAGLAVAITGFAGPVRGEQEEGLVYIACAREGIEVIHREARFGPVGRAGVRREAIGVALDMMKEALTT